MFDDKKHREREDEVIPPEAYSNESRYRDVVQGGFKNNIAASNIDWFM